jgi:hypothetical protein
MEISWSQYFLYNLKLISQLMVCNLQAVELIRDAIGADVPKEMLWKLVPPLYP